MIGFKKFFSKPSDHPLARDEHVTTVLADLPVGDPAQSLQDLTHWLILLASEDKLKNRASKLFRLDQAAQGAERKLRTQYIEASRLHKAIEERIWNTAFEFLEASINAHHRCIAEYLEEGRANGSADLAAMVVRTIRRLDLEAHWISLRYQPLPDSVWEQVYALIKLAEDKQLLRVPVMLNPTTGAQTTFVQEVLKLLMMAVSDPRQFTKGQMALARHLTSTLADTFVWEDIPGNSAVFHIDFSKRQLPTRLTQTSEQHFMARCFGPGAAVHRLVTAMKQVEQGAIPSSLGLSDPSTYRRGDLLEVLARLSQSWSRARPVSEHQHFDKRHHERKPSFVQICVVHGFNALHRALNKPAASKAASEKSIVDRLTYDGQVDTQIFGFVRERTLEQQQRLQSLAEAPAAGSDQHCESWVVRDVSEAGFGVEITTTPEDWVAPNVPVGIHLDTGEWQIGIIRRRASSSVENTEVGIQVLSRDPRAAMMRPVDSQLTVWETSADTQTYYHTPAILLPPEPQLHEDECLLVAANSYQLHKLYQIFVGDQKRVIRLLDRLAAYGDTDQVIFADVAASSAQRPRP